MDHDIFMFSYGWICGTNILTKSWDQTIHQFLPWGMVRRPLGQEEAGAEGFKYLLSMKMWSLTENKVQARTRRGDGVPAGSSGGA